MMSATLAATTEQAVLQIAIFAALVVAVVAVLWVRNEREQRLLAQRRVFQAEQAINALQTSRDESVNAKRNDVLFEQHRRMNQLTIAKLEGEVQLMQAQIQARGTHRDREDVAKEYHELMIEKTKLEMDSLRLHIAELRKREDMNQLTIAKLEAEVQLMQTQIQTRETHRDQEDAAKEYRELMVEKTKLEMDSLRLHIAELRKRMEDWNAD